MTRASSVRLLVAVLLAAALPAGRLAAQDRAAAPRHTLSGYVVDAESGEALIGANLYARALQRGAVTNAYGYYSLILPADSVEVVVSYIGYTARAFRLRLSADRTLRVELAPDAVALDGVEVVAERGGALHEESQMSAIEVPMAAVEQVPALLGEADVLKTLQLLPGAQSGTEGTSGLYVRGGGPDQNLILLDGAPVYNVSHLFGFFSVFNADAIQRVNLIKGGFPARYGGRLSSVVDIAMKEGNLRRFEGEGAVGLIASRLTLQGPIRKDRTSFLVSGRRTYADLLVQPFLDDPAGYYFYDVNAKLNHVVSANDRVYLSFYGGDDRFYSRFEDEREGIRDAFAFDFGWGNLTSTLRWNHVVGPRLFANVMASYSRYRFDITSEDVVTATTPDGPERDVFYLRYTSGIRDLAVRADVDYAPAPDHAVRFGGHATHHTFRPGATQVREEFDDVVDTDTLLAPSTAVPALEAGLYVEDDVRLTRRLKVNAGLHASLFAVEGRTYGSVQPRVSARFLLTSTLSAKASYAAMEQYVHLLTNSSVGLPTDLWVPATDVVRPQQAHQVAAGLAQTLGDGVYEVSLEGYYKTMRGLVEYRDGATFAGAIDDDWEGQVTQGDGRAYGAELFVQRRRGRTTGWLGYTLSWTERTFADLNDGRTFPYRYDRRHDVAVVVTRTLSPRADLALTWVYGTGMAMTIPVARLNDPEQYLAEFHRLLYGSGYFGWETKVYGDRNGYRMAPYHRFDLGLTFTWPTRRGARLLRLGAYNAYNRKNPFFLYFDDEFDARTGDFRRVARRVSLFPVLPSISYQFRF